MSVCVSVFYPGISILGSHTYDEQVETDGDKGAVWSQPGIPFEPGYSWVKRVFKSAGIKQKFRFK